MKLLISLILLILSHSSFSQTYVTEDIITGLTEPVAFAFLPNGNIILTQKQGLVRIFNQSNQQISTFWNFADSCLSVQELGTIGIVLDPAFNTNHFIYIYYIHKIPPVLPGDYNHRIIRFVENGNAGIFSAKIFDYLQNGNIGQNHAAGNMNFGADGKLYFSIGDLTGAQQLNSPRGKIHRINSDGTIPVDNPFYDDGNPATGNDDRIWVLGLRNPFDFCISPINDSIYCGDNGSGPDEINFIRKGKNYGFPVCNGICGNPLYKDPILQMPAGTVPTGMIVYSGSQFPTLYNKLIFAAHNSSKIYICSLGNSPNFDTITSYSEWINFGTYTGPTTIKQGTDGFIYVCQLGSGKIIRIRPDPNAINNNNNPVNFYLSQNFPNPFNPLTTIKYEIPNNSLVSLRIYDVLGIEISSPVNETKQQGSYEVSWDASSFPSGIYFYELQAGEYKDRKKMVLIK